MRQEMRTAKLLADAEQQAGAQADAQRRSRNARRYNANTASAASTLAHFPP